MKKVDSPIRCCICDTDRGLICNRVRPDFLKQGTRVIMDGLPFFIYCDECEDAIEGINLRRSDHGKMRFVFGDT
jgi:hypothetical protein